MTEDFDVVVVGAGPAGSMAARTCAQRGARVLLVDREPFPRWKVCGACLGPGGRHALERARLGDLPFRLGAVPLVHLRLTSGGTTARIRLRGNVAISRRAFDEALAHEAVAAGVVVRTGVRAELLPDDDEPGRTLRLRARDDAGDATFARAAVVVDATGLGGLGGDRPDVVEGARVGVGGVLGEAPPDFLPGDLHMVVGATGYVGLVRDEDGHLNVAAALDRTAMADRSVTTALRSVLDGAGVSDILRAEPLHGWKGTPALTRSHARLADRGLFRIGDAGGYVEPFTGEGIGWALSAGLDVTPHVLEALGGWREEIGLRWHDEQSRRMRRAQRFCRMLAGGLRRPTLVRASMRVLHRYPALATPFVAAGSTPVTR